MYCTWSGINNNIDKIYGWFLQALLNLPKHVLLGIWQSKVDLITGNSLTPAEHIFSGTLPNNSSARPEGPHIYLVNGTYYLLIAEGGFIYPKNTIYSF